MKTCQLMFIAFGCLLMINLVSTSTSYTITAYVSYCQYPSWVSDNIYTQEMKVSYEGHHYKANYQNLGDIPNDLNNYAWADMGACSQITHGTISNQGDNTVVAGGSITFNYAADQGYSIRDIVADCCTSIPITSSSYTFSNVQSDHFFWVYIKAPDCYPTYQNSVPSCSQYDNYTCACETCDSGYYLTPDGTCVQNNCETISNCLSVNTVSCLCNNCAAGFTNYLSHCICSEIENCFIQDQTSCECTRCNNDYTLNNKKCVN